MTLTQVFLLQVLLVLTVVLQLELDKQFTFLTTQVVVLKKVSLSKLIMLTVNLKLLSMLLQVYRLQVQVKNLQYSFMVLNLKKELKEWLIL